MNTVFYQVSHKCYNNQWGDLQSAKLLALLNQRCMVDIVMLLYMVLLQEFLHPPRASRDDCGERIAKLSIPLRVANYVYFVFESFVQSFKGPSKKLKPVKPVAATQGRHITMPHLALRHKRSYLPAVPIDPTAAGLISVVP